MPLLITYHEYLSLQRSVGTRVVMAFAQGPTCVPALVVILPLAVVRPQVSSVLRSRFVSTKHPGLYEKQNLTSFCLIFGHLSCFQP